MSAYHSQHVKEEHRANLEQRRNRLKTLLQEERDRLEVELGEVVPDRNTLTDQLRQKREELRTAREERRKKVGYVPPANHWAAFSRWQQKRLLLNPSWQKSCWGSTGRRTTQSCERWQNFHDFWKLKGLVNNTQLLFLNGVLSFFFYSRLFRPQVETELHKDYVVSQWQKQISEKKQVNHQHRR